MSKIDQWDQTELGRIAMFTNGGAWKAGEYVEAGISVVRVTDCKKETVDLSACKYLPLSAFERYGKHELIEGDLIIATVGSHPTQPASVVGRPIVVPREAAGSLLNQNAVCVRPKNELLNKRFLSFFAKAPSFSEYIIACARGSANQVRMAIGLLKKMPVFLPPRSTQNKIASILSAYDDLIENNTRRIKILEEMAQTIYREWFVNFRFPGHEKVKMADSPLGKIPEGWEVIQLGEKVDFRRGKNITKKQVIPGDVPVVAAGLKPACYHNESNVKSPVVTISASGANAGFIRLYHEDIWASDCSYINKVSAKTIFYFYSFLKNRQGEVTGLQRGAAQPHVYPKDVMRMLIVDAPGKLIIQFEEISRVIFNEIGNLKLKNVNLRQTRDLLLPKLISGEIDVSELDIEMEKEV